MTKTKNGPRTFQIRSNLMEELNDGDGPQNSSSTAVHYAL